MFKIYKLQISSKYNLIIYSNHIQHSLFAVQVGAVALQSFLLHDLHAWQLLIISQSCGMLRFVSLLIIRLSYIHSWKICHSHSNLVIW